MFNPYNRDDQRREAWEKYAEKEANTFAKERLWHENEIGAIEIAVTRVEDAAKDACTRAKVDFKQIADAIFSKYTAADDIVAEFERVTRELNALADNQSSK